MGNPHEPLVINTSPFKVEEVVVVVVVPGGGGGGVLLSTPQLTQ